MSLSVYDVIRTKRAVREFRDEPLPDDIVREILNAGRLSGSSKNTQPWHFIAVCNRQTLQALATTGRYAGHLAGAALGVVIVAPDPPPAPHALGFDLGRAAQNMMLAAWGRGVGSVVAAIYEPERAAEILGVPSGYRVEWAISFGYPAQPQDRPPRKGGRRPFDEVVHWERW